MIAPVYKHAFKALLPDKGIYLFWLIILIVMATARANSDFDFQYGDFIITVAYFAFVSGSLLTALLAKPIVFCLPHQRRILQRSVLLLDLLYCILGALVCLLLIESSGRIRSISEFASVVLLALTLFQLIVFAMLNSWSKGWLWFVLVIALAMLRGTDPVAIRLQTAFLFFSDQPLLCLLLALGSTILISAALSRNLLRNLCGKFVMTFADMMNMKREAELNARLKQQKLREKSRFLQQHPVHRGVDKLASRLPTSVPGHAWYDFRTLSSSKNWWVTLFWILGVTTMILSGNGNNSSWHFLLFFPVVLVLSELHSLFRKRFSPALPVSRARFFKESLYKGGALYLLAIGIVAAELLLFDLLLWLLPDTAGSYFATFGQLSFKLVFYFALLAPIAAWSGITLRSILPLVTFSMAFATTFIVVTHFYIESFLQLGTLEIVLITVLAWLPFLLRSYVVNFRRDLIVQ